MKFTPLEKKISKSQDVIQKAMGKFDPGEIALAWTGGKDSTVLLHLVRDLYAGKIPMPVLFNDSTMEFKEVYAFIKKLSQKWNLQLIRVKHLDKDLKQFKTETSWEVKQKLARHMKINAINRALEKYQFRAFIAGIRWDEHPARAKESYLSRRSNHWRIHPILHFTEADIWHYIRTHAVPYVNLYDQGYRSLGEAPFTRKATKTGGERSGREYDKEKVMQTLRKLGYW